MRCLSVIDCGTLASAAEILPESKCNELMVTWRLDGWHDRICYGKRRGGGDLTFRYEMLLSPFLPLIPLSKSRNDGAQCAAHPRKRPDGLALTARGGCYGDNQAGSYIHRLADRARQPPPRGDIIPSFPLSQTATTKSMTPTFQVDDLRCIVDARAATDLT